MKKLEAGDPQRIGAYRLLARLGAGGMGRVYLARSDRGRTVAVKLVRGELAAQEEFRARFRQEVQAARRVGGHWTAPVLDADTEAAVPWVATGYVAGPSLQEVVGHDHGALPERSVRILAAGLAHALKDIHAAGLIHRDLKPSNVLVTIDGPRVIDFGIARALETLAGDGLTRTGALVGSPGFMAPEQVRGDRITPASDVYSLGSELAYAATGALPFGTANSGVHALMFRIAQDEPDLDGVPEGIADLVRECLRKDPAARPTLDRILERTGAEDTVSGGRSRDPWLPSALVAQLGRHAVQLLDAEDPEGEQPAPTPAPVSGPDSDSDPAPDSEPGQAAQEPAPAPAPDRLRKTPPAPEASPEHASASDDSSAVASPPAAGSPDSRPPGQPGGGAPLDHLPTIVAGPGGPAQTPPPGPPGAAGPHPAYGYPQQHPQPPADGYPQQPGGTTPYNPYGGGGGAYGATPPYGPPPVGSTSPYGVPQEPRRSGRSTALLVGVALVVALGAGGSVYALMNGGGHHSSGGATTSQSPTTTPTTSGPTTGTPSPTASQSPSESPTGGVIPTGYLGTWTSSIDNSTGHNTRELTIRQGNVGESVLTLVADGPSYHCEFEAKLTQQPGGDGPLEMGASNVTSGQPLSSCNPGQSTEITLLPDGTLQRVNTSNGEKLTYTKEG
jgi:serine/threonine protein kinase